MHNCKCNRSLNSEFERSSITIVRKMCICLQAPNHKKKIICVFSFGRFGSSCNFNQKKKIICTNCCNSITSLIYTVMNAVDGRIFGVTCAAKDFRRVHIWNGIRSLVFAWKAIYNYLCWSIEIWSADRSTQEKNKQMMNGTKTETTQRVEYKKEKKFTQRQSHTISLQWHTKIKKIITLNIRTRNNSSQLIERRCFDVPKAKKKQIKNTND